MATRRSLTGIAITFSLIGGAEQADVRYVATTCSVIEDPVEETSRTITDSGKGERKERLLWQKLGRDVRRKVETTEKEGRGHGRTAGREGCR